MRSESLPETPRARLTWALRESLILAGILLFWLGVGALLTAVLSLLRVGIAAVGFGRGFRPLVGLLDRTEFLWPAITQLAVGTALLYVLVRAGTLLIDYYRGGERDT